MIADIKKSAEQKMRKTVETLKTDLAKVRTGRARRTSILITLGIRPHHAGIDRVPPDQSRHALGMRADASRTRDDPRVDRD